MFAASRVANISRTVLPYAQWVFYVVQLGYFGYNLYHMYRDYVHLVETDAREGRPQRSLDEAMTLVVKPMRRHQESVLRNSREETTGNISNSNPSEIQSQDNPGPSTSTVTIQEVSNEDKENITTNQSIVDGINETNSPEVSIIHDTRVDGPYPGPSSEFKHQEPSNLCDETLSVASTSIESTDSNRGIIDDMYSQCFICARSLDDPGKPVATLPFCMHPFHKSCLDGVLKWHQKCPVCDFHIFSPI